MESLRYNPFAFKQGTLLLSLLSYIFRFCPVQNHYIDVIMSTMASQITSLTSVSTCVHQRKHQSSAVTGLVRGSHRGLVNSPHKGPITQKMFPFDDVIMYLYLIMWDTQSGECYQKLDLHHQCQPFSIHDNHSHQPFWYQWSKAALH